MRSETQSASSKIWTLVADPIFYDDNRSTKSVPAQSAGAVEYTDYISAEE